uniref:Mite group 2 allergen Pso o 2 n=1 Tax=Caligus clemensi TaxID=344056 RepID=C1C1S6_CALCM|nr:Mite group 2 allergen Pso o 2 precursor [Caligus clemensi]
MKCFVVVLLALAGISYGLDVNDCGSKGAEILKLDFPGCDKEPCVVHKGDQLKAKLYLRATKPTDYLDCKLFADYNGLEIPYPGGCDEPDACNALLEGSCPVAIGDEMTYDVSIYIAKLFPTTVIDGQWRIMDEDDEIFSCFKIQMDIQD